MQRYLVHRRKWYRSHHGSSSSVMRLQHIVVTIRITPVCGWEKRADLSLAYRGSGRCTC